MARDRHGGKKSFESCRCPRRWRYESLVPRKKKSHPPFNSGVSIDVKRGMHPKLAKNYTDAPPPGTYDPKTNTGSSGHVTNWEREEATKEFSASMGGRSVEKYVVQRELMRSGLGPGTHEVKQWPENFLEKNCAAEARDTAFGGTPRFKNTNARSTPGPGYTGKNHNPFHYVDGNRFKSHSRLPTFEFDGLRQRFKKASENRSVACNRYDVRHPKSLDVFLRKSTSRRGPYDLFTGPRNATTLRGYLAQPVSLDSKNWPLGFVGEFENAFGGPNRYKGVWADCPRFPKKPTVRSMLEDASLCYKDPDSPGPGSYDPVSPPPPNSTRRAQPHPPFNDSVQNSRPLRPFDISPGPATYDLVTDRKRIPGDGWTSTFKSKTQRSIGPRRDEYNSF